MFLVIYHPFYFCKELSSKAYFHKYGELTKDFRFPWIKMPEMLTYIKDIVATLIIVIRSKRRYHLYIGADCLNAFVGLILRKLKLVNKVILYTIDLPVVRFKSSLKNKLYHLLNISCAYHCDIIWDLSRRMNLVRKMYGMKEKLCSPIIVVPSCMRISHKLVSKLKSNKDTKILVFLGHLVERQGLQLVISAMPLLIRKIPNIKLLIIGTGPYEVRLKTLAKQLGLLNKYVIFLGYIGNHETVEQILKKADIGLAPYVPDPYSITMYADPMKPKVYMACGLPVIITKFPTIAKLIWERKAGIVINYDVKDLIDAIIKMLSNDHTYKSYKINALKLAQEFSCDKVFSKALLSTFHLLITESNKS